MSDQEYPKVPNNGTNAGPVPGVGEPAGAGGDSVQAIGAHLAHLRGEKGWSIEDISTRLKVSPVKLRALEAGDLSRLPDLTFVIGIVRGYTNMLGVDPAPFIAALRRARGPVEPDLSLPASSGGGLPRGRVAVSWNGEPKRRSWWWGLLLVALVGLALAMWRNGGESTGWLAHFTAAGSASPEAASTASADDNASSPASAAPEASTANAVDAAQDGLPRPILAPDASAAARTLAAVSAPPSGTAAAPPAVAQDNTAVVPLAGQSTLQFKVSQESWIGVREAGGKQVFSGLVAAGQMQSVQGIAPLMITLGNRAGLISLEVDGKLVDATKYANAKGNVARFTVP